MVIALVGLASFIIGTAFGVYQYSFLHRHFSKDITAKAYRQFTAEALKAKMIEQKIIQTRLKLRERFGDDLSEKHQEVADEEILNILGQGPK